MDSCVGISTNCLYNDPSTSCSYARDYGANYSPVPGNILDSLYSLQNCGWLEGIINERYTAQDVWRNLLPANIYNPNSTNCYGEQYLAHVGLSKASDREYSYRRNWLIPRGLSVLADSCGVEACRRAGETGNPDMTGIGMLVAYAFELFFITVLFLSRAIGPGAGGGEALNDATNRCQCLAEKMDRHPRCAEGCECSAVMIHSDKCDAMYELELRRSAIEKHYHAIKETTPTFLDTAIFFSLSVAIGIIATDFSQGMVNYEERIVAFVSILVASPPYTVLALSFKTLRRKRLRRNLSSLAVILLSLGVVAPAFSVGGGWRDRWGAICFFDNIRFMAIKTAMALSFGAFFLVCELCRLLLWRFQRAAANDPSREFFKKPFFEQMSKPHPWDDLDNLSWWQWALSFCKRYIYNWTTNKITTWLVATLTLVFAYFGAGHLAGQRARMERLAGQTYNESQMTYGQYLAAFIWVPVIAEYVYHVVSGTTRALESRLPTHYTATRSPPIAIVVEHV